MVSIQRKTRNARPLRKLFSLLQLTKATLFQ